MALDIEIRAEIGAAVTTKTLKIESWEFRMVPSSHMQHALKNLPFLHDATGDKSMPTWLVDFGDRIEQFILNGIISEGTPANNFEKFEEYRGFFRRVTWRGETYLKIGALVGFGGAYHSEVKYPDGANGSTKGYMGTVADFRCTEVSPESKMNYTIVFLMGIEFFK